jgi:peptide deformylase
MAKRPIIILPDPVLRQPSKPVERVDAGVRALIADMFETMYDAPGVGLAAVQVGVLQRVLVIDVADPEEKQVRKPLAMINPQIIKLGDIKKSFEEGCLSIPDVLVEIERPTSLTIRYLDRDGGQQTLNADGLLATAIQHELDHLDGKLIIDFLSRLKRDMVVRKFKKMARV